MKQLESTDQYRNLLTSRYSSPQMSEIFSEKNRASLWRDLWIFLAEEQMKLGLPIKPKQIAALKKAKEDIRFDDIRQIESQLKHDVMAHLKAYGKLAPEAEPILHLGATSAFITDNADVLLFRDASLLLLRKMQILLEEFKKAILKWKDLEVTGFTHFQPAQPVTLGKRFSLWAQDLVWDLEELKFCVERLRPLGCKGTTGTQSSFEILFKGKKEKVLELDNAVCQRMGFSEPVSVSGQTLSRKVDCWFLNALANLASTFSKMSYDLRLLQHLREVTEAFGKNQVGSSAMPYKQNPMLAERITGLSRFLMNLAHNGPWTHATQWLERSLDDSSNRRIVIPEAFLTADALCEAMHRWITGFRVFPEESKKRLAAYEHYFVSEGFMMEETLKGGSRQDIHEDLRKAAVSGKLKSKGQRGQLSGLSSLQAEAFVKTELDPKLGSAYWKNFPWDLPDIEFKSASV